jgi:hypothetical protein
LRVKRRQFKTTRQVSQRSPAQQAAGFPATAESPLDRQQPMVGLGQSHKCSVVSPFVRVKPLCQAPKQSHEVPTGHFPELGFCVPEDRGGFFRIDFESARRLAVPPMSVDKLTDEFIFDRPRRVVEVKVHQ